MSAASVRTLYDANISEVQPADRPVVMELCDKVEGAPGANRCLKVLRVEQVDTPLLSKMWHLQVQKLSLRALDPRFPKPTWRDPDYAEPCSELRDQEASHLHEREKVWEHLKTISSRWEDAEVWTTRVFHGAPSYDVARSICELGFTANVQRTKGWFGEGPYASPSPTYALRYSMGMQDFWDARGCKGYIVAARACWSQVYPATQADNTEGELTPGLKGKPVGGLAAQGAIGCDAHFACVRGTAPHGEERRRTYHCCQDGQRPDSTELVVREECQLLPEYILEVAVTEDERTLQLAKLMAEHWGRRPSEAQSKQDEAGCGERSREPSYGAASATGGLPGQKFVVPPRSTQRPSSQWSQCAICKQVGSGQILKDHEKSVHQPLLRCLDCGKIFDCSDDLRKHSRMKQHSISVVFRMENEMDAADVPTS